MQLIHTAFPGQQLLHERTSVLRKTHIACFVIKLMITEQIHVDIFYAEFFTNWTKADRWDLYKNLDLTGIA